MRKTAFLLHDSLNGGVATWTKFVDENLEKKNLIIDNFTINRDIKNLSFSTFLKLYKYIKSKNIVRLIVGNSTPALYGKFIKLLNPKIELIYVTHGWGWSYQSLLLKCISFVIEFLTIPLVDKLVYVSEEDKNKSKLFVFKPEEVILPNINFKKLTLKTAVNKRKKVLFVGRNSHPKRLDLFVELSKINKDTDWFVVGTDGIDLKNLFYLGEVYNFNEYYKYDYFILLSESEGNPLVLHEALSSGLQCMINKLPYNTEFIKDWNSQLIISESLELNDLAKSFKKLKKTPLPNNKDLLKKNNNLRTEFINKIRLIFK